MQCSAFCSLLNTRRNTGRGVRDHVLCETLTRKARYPDDRPDTGILDLNLVNLKREPKNSPTPRPQDNRYGLHVPLRLYHHSLGVGNASDNRLLIGSGPA